MKQAIVSNADLTPLHQIVSDASHVNDVQYMSDSRPSHQGLAQLSHRLWLWWVTGAQLTWIECRRHGLLVGLLAVIWCLALLRVFGGAALHRPLLPIVFNWTPSLPYHVAVVDYRWNLKRPLARGDFVIYAFAADTAIHAYPGLDHQAFFKKVAGLPGDTVTVNQRDVFVNGNWVGRAKTQTFDHRALEPIVEGVIAPGQLYVQGSSPDSFDSRYALSGLVNERDLLARVMPVF